MNQRFDPQQRQQQLAGWDAEIRLRFAVTSRGTRLVGNEHQGPLYVQKAFYPEGHECAHAYLLHPPGGLVSGDNLHIHVVAENHSQVLLTTPGAGRVYRARSDGILQQQHIQLDVADDACLEWLPLETILFPGARAKMTTRINLAERGCCVAWDVISLGLPANKAPFDHGEFDQRLQVYQQNHLMLNERIVINEQTQSLLSARAGFRQAPVHGVMIAGPFKDAISDDDLNQLRQVSAQIGTDTTSTDMAAVTLCGHYLVGRYLGYGTDKARHYFTQLWFRIRPLLAGREPCIPRIWST